MDRKGWIVFAATIVMGCPVAAHAQTCSEQVSDGSFEAGSPNPSWSEFSTNFGTPLCDANCFDQPDTGARTGDWWVWFGGVEVPEDGSVEQDIFLPAGSDATLSFWFMNPASSGNAQDFMAVRVDDVEIFRVLEGDPLYADDYTEITLFLSQFADGGSHTLRFESSVTGSPTHSNFFLDDVSVETCQAQTFDPCQSGPTTMCLRDNRFQVEVEWRTAEGDEGPGQVVPVGSDRTGLFYFFKANNWEMLLKILNGCTVNEHFWVFFAATTDVEFELTVIDTEADVMKTYTNVLGQPADAVTDTSAFATCP